MEVTVISCLSCVFYSTYTIISCGARHSKSVFVGDGGCTHPYCVDVVVVHTLTVLALVVVQTLPCFLALVVVHTHTLNCVGVSGCTHTPLPKVRCVRQGGLCG